MMRRSVLIITGMIFLILCVLSLLAAREKRADQSNHFRQSVSKKIGAKKPDRSQTTVASEWRGVKKMRPAKRKVTVAKNMKTVTVK